MARKTMPVALTVTLVNRMLKDSTCNRDTRLGMIAALETVLHETENYQGYMYLTEYEVPRGHLPGISGISGDFKFPDDSRRRYMPPKTQ